MSKHDVFDAIGEGVVMGGALGLGIALIGMFFGKDEPNTAQLDAEKRRLELELLQAQIDRANRT